MYNKPTGFSSPFQSNQASTPGFGTAGFGASTPAAGSSIFGQNNAQTTGGGLFGGTTSAFGTQPSTGFNFGATPSAAGGLFGAKTTASTGLFGTPAANASTAFGFGSAGNSMSGGFGTTSTASTGTLFGTSTNPAGSLFGSSGGFGGQAQQPGTTVKFIPFAATDTMVKNGTTQTINTRLQCITAMKEYENKSMEELRVEDYLAGRKGQALPTTGFGFASPVTSTQQSAQTAPFSFGATKPNGFGTTTGFGTSTSTGTGGLFGQPSQTGLATGGLFGQSKPGGFFNTATTTAAQTGFGGFGTSTSTGTGGLFGNTAQKPLFGTTTTQATGLFGTGTGTTGFGQPAASTGFGGFGTSTPATGGLFGNKPGGFGTQTTASAFGFGSGSMTGSNLFSKPIPASTGFGGFPAATTQPTGFGAPQPFGAAKQTGFGGLSTSTATPSFNFNTFNTGTSLFGTNNTLNKPAFGGLGTTGSTGFGGFGTTTTQLGTAPTLGGQVNPPAANQAVQLQQTLLALTHSPYGDSKLFSNMKETSIKREDVLKPTNPAAQKAILANQHKVSPRPMSKIKPKALTGNLNGSKSQLFDGLEEEEFSFGNDTFQARKSVKKLTLKKIGSESNTPSRASSVSGEPAMMSSLRDDDNYRGRVSPVTFADDRPRPRDADNAPDTENIIRSKGISEQINDTPNRGTNMDDTIAILNARNKSSSIADPPVMMKSQNDTVNISIISHDDSNTEEINVDERPMTPPPPHPAGIVLMRPGYYIIPPLEALAELVDEDGNCYVEDFTIGREGYGSIFFPGMTNVANMNFDEIVFFRRKEVIVYPDDDNKPPEGDGLNKKAEITLDCVWPRDKSAGTPIKSPEKLRAMNWQEKIEFNSMKVGAKFIDYRPETGSWVFEVKHFSKYGLLDDSDEEEVSEQDKKRLRTSQAQQVAVQDQ